MEHEINDIVLVNNFYLNKEGFHDRWMEMKIFMKGETIHGDVWYNCKREEKSDNITQTYYCMGIIHGGKYIKNG